MLFRESLVPLSLFLTLLHFWVDGPDYGFKELSFSFCKIANLFNSYWIIVMNLKFMQLGIVRVGGGWEEG